MDTLVISLKDLFATQEEAYVNQYGIEFRMQEGQLKLFLSEIYEVEDFRIELCLSYSCEDFQKLVRDTNLHDEIHLHSITRDHLLELFHKGLCQLAVFIGYEMDAPMLLFSYKNDNLFVINDFDEISVVTTNLQTPEEFLCYTIQYFGNYPDGYPL